MDVKQISYAIGKNIDHEVLAILKQENYDALVVTSWDQNIVWVNQGFTEMTGYNKKYALGKKPNFLQGADTSNRIKKQIKEGLQNNHRYNVSIVNYRKNGETYRCQIKILPLSDSKQELSHFIALEKEGMVA
nr:PAS domain-containing protein [uncultured Allomuricauda sp.]